MEQCGTYVDESRVHGALQLTSHFRVHALAAVDVLCSATTGRRHAVDQRMRHVVADAEREAAHARLAGLAPDEVHDAAGVLHFAVGERLAESYPCRVHASGIGGLSEGVGGQMVGAETDRFRLVHA